MQRRAGRHGHQCVRVCRVPRPEPVIVLPADTGGADEGVETVVGDDLVRLAHVVVVDGAFRNGKVDIGEFLLVAYFEGEGAANIVVGACIARGVFLCPQIGHTRVQVGIGGLQQSSKKL